MVTAAAAATALPANPRRLDQSSIRGCMFWPLMKHGKTFFTAILASQPKVFPSKIVMASLCIKCASPVLAWYNVRKGTESFQGPRVFPPAVAFIWSEVATTGNAMTAIVIGPEAAAAKKSALWHDGTLINHRKHHQLVHFLQRPPSNFNDHLSYSGFFLGHHRCCRE